MLKFLLGTNLGFLLGAALMVFGFSNMSIEDADMVRSLYGNKEARRVLTSGWKREGVKEYKEYLESKSEKTE